MGYGNTDIVQAIDKLRLNGFASTATAAAAPPIAMTPTPLSAGASASGTIPAGSVGFSFIIFTGTGSLGGQAVSAGFSQSSSNKLKSGLAWTTGANSSAWVYYETP